MVKMRIMKSKTRKMVIAMQTGPAVYFCFRAAFSCVFFCSSI
jgi:hypothetical protein